MLVTFSLFYLTRNMSQIKKHQTGGQVTKSTLVEKPVDVAPVKKNQLTFNVDGEEFNMDEKDFTSIADKAFSNEVRKGQAKLRDKGKWMQAFNDKLAEAKTGRFNVQSSGDAVSNLSYTPNDPNYDASKTSGLNPDGTVAQRTAVGQFIAPRATGSENRMASILNNYIGEGIVGSRNKYLENEKAKALAAKTSATDAYNTSVKTDAATLANQSLGKLAFGADWDNPQARKLILDKVWGKEPGHVASIDAAFQKHVGRLYDPYYTGKEADYLKEGVDIKGLRDKFSSIYDPNTKTFKTPLKGIGDLYKYSDLLDSIASDSPLFNRNAYKASIAPPVQEGQQVGQGGPGQGINAPVVTGQAQSDLDRIKAMGAVKEGNLWRDKDGRYYADAALTRTPTGKWTDNKYYSSGYLRSGKYAPTEIGPDGRPMYNYYSPEAGFYVGGQKADQSTYNKYIENLQKDPSKKAEFDRIAKHNLNIDQTYAEGNFVDKMSKGFLDDKNITEHGEYAFKNFGSTFKPAGATNITSMFRRGDEPVKGGIFAYQSKTLNHLGIPDAETAVLTDDGYNYRGVMRQGADGKLKLFKKNPDNTLSEIKDKRLNDYLSDLTVDRSRYNPESGVNMLLNRSQFRPNVQNPNVPLPTTAPIGSRLLQALTTPNPDVPNIFQVGGIIQRKMIANTGGYDPNKITNTTTGKTKGTNVSNLFKSGYEMSTQEKLEAAALAADLTGVGLSLTGAGSIAAAGVGAAGTTAQLAADIRRDGLDWGDAGNAALGYGLDALSAIPGLGIGAKGAKVFNTIKRSAKYLLPGLAAIGAGKAAALLSDVAFGDKKMTDLSVDDLRTLTNGIHGVIGGARAINNNAALKRSTTSSLALKEGNVNLEPDQLTVLSKLEGPDRVTQAKLFAIENLNKNGGNVSDVELKTVKDGLISKAKFWNPNSKSKEVVDVSNTRGGVELKDIDNYQGNSYKDRYMRWAIDKAATRNPELSSKYLDLDNASRAKQWGALGDYTRKNQYTGSSIYGDFSVSGPSSVTGPSSIIGPTSVVGPSSTYGPSSIVPELGVRFNSRTGQTSMFKDGGIIKAQGGVKMPYSLPSFFADYAQKGPIRLSTQVPTEAELLTQKYTTGINDVLGIPKTTQSTLGPVNPNAIATIVPVTTGPSKGQGLAVTGTGNWMSKLKNLGSKINVNDLSEFGRALATRGVNQRIDTRVEAPLMSAPAEVSVPVQGNLLTQNAYLNRAADTQRRGGIPTSSDANLFTIQNLEAGRQADQLRTQGSMENANAINQSRAQNLENTARNNSVRNEIANRNISTLANAKQAERSAENQKIGLVAQPLLSYWENMNAEGLRKQASNNQIDQQIALSSLSNTVGDIKHPLMLRATDLYSKSLDPRLDPVQRKMYNDQYEAVQKQLEGLGIAAKTNALQLMKDRNYVAPGDYYSKYTKPVYAKGGIITLSTKDIKSMNDSNMIAYKERLKEVKTQTSDDAKTAAATAKAIQALINQALKSK